MIGTGTPRTCSFLTAECRSSIWCRESWCWTCFSPPLTFSCRPCTTAGCLFFFLKTKKQRHDYWLLFWLFFMRPIDIYSRTSKPCFLYDSVAWCPTLIIILQVCWRNDPGLLIMSCIKNQRYSDYCCAGTFFWLSEPTGRIDFLRNLQINSSQYNRAVKSL